MAYPMWKCGSSTPRFSIGDIIKPTREYLRCMGSSTKQRDFVGIVTKVSGKLLEFRRISDENCWRSKGRIDSGWVQQVCNYTCCCTHERQNICNQTKYDPIYMGDIIITTTEYTRDNGSAEIIGKVVGICKRDQNNTIFEIKPCDSRYAPIKRLSEGWVVKKPTSMCTCAHDGWIDKLCERLRQREPKFQIGDYVKTKSNCPRFAKHGEICSISEQCGVFVYEFSGYNATKYEERDLEIYCKEYSSCRRDRCSCCSQCR